VRAVEGRRKSHHAWLIDVDKLCDHLSQPEVRAFNDAQQFAPFRVGHQRAAKPLTRKLADFVRVMDSHGYTSPAKLAAGRDVRNGSNAAVALAST